MQEACGEEWQRVLDMFQQNRIALEREGTSFIDCADPGKQLRPMPYNCTSMEHLGEKFGHLLYPHSLYSLSLSLSLSILLSFALSLSPLYSQFYQLKKVLCSLQVKGAMWYILFIAISVGALVTATTITTIIIITTLLCVFRLCKRRENIKISYPTTHIRR